MKRFYVNCVVTVDYDEIKLEEAIKGETEYTGEGRDEALNEILWSSCFNALSDNVGTMYEAEIIDYDEIN